MNCQQQTDQANRLGYKNNLVNAAEPFTTQIVHKRNDPGVTKMNAKMTWKVAAFFQVM